MTEEVKYIVIVHMLGVLVACAFIFFILMFCWSLVMRKKDRQAALMIAEINEAKNAVEKVDKIKTDFINSITHDIRTPLNAINGYVNLILEEGNDIAALDKEEFAGVINQNTDKLSLLVDDLLDLSSIGNETYNVILANYRIADVVNNAFNSAKPQKDVEVSMKYELALDTTILCDKDMVQKILRVLIDNACKFTSEGSIEVGCSKSMNDNSRIQFTVTDTGIGVPPEKSEEIFRKFVKLNEWTEGSGIGLYLARRMTRLLNGKLFLDTTYLKGARFVLELPESNA